MADYTRYLQALIDDRRADPREDLLSDLIHGANGYPGVPDEHVHNIIRGAARVAGFDTTRDAITATMLVILQNPGVADQVRANPTKAILRVTEEALRRDAPHRGLFRITTRDTTLGGTDLPAGSALLLRSARATATRPRSRVPTTWSWTGPMSATTSPSAAACTSAPAPRWPVRRSGWRWRRSSSAYPASV
jgi:cytochrome P450